MAEKSIFIISSATGETATFVLQAVLAQFPVNKDNVRIEHFANVKNIQELEEILAKALQINAAIVNSLIIPELRIVLITFCRVNDLIMLDVLGQFVERIDPYFDDEQPLWQSGLLHQLDESYSQRIMAMEYVVMHDDGRNVEGLPLANVVLVGISRSAKTPLSLYLASRGVLVGNVPLIYGIDPPSILFTLDIDKVFGLIVRPSRLVQIRKDRIERLGAAGGDYEELDKIREEVKHARMLYARAGWTVIDMTSRSIESAAEEILRRIGHR